MKRKSIVVSLWNILRRRFNNIWSFLLFRFSIAHVVWQMIKMRIWRRHDKNRFKLKMCEWFRNGNNQNENVFRFSLRSFVDDRRFFVPQFHLWPLRKSCVEGGDEKKKREKIRQRKTGNEIHLINQQKQHVLYAFSLRVISIGVVHKSCNASVILRLNFRHLF